MKQFLRKLQALEFEEKVLNTGVLICLIGTFLPWFGGQWLGGETVNYSAFGFLISVIGTVIFLLSVATLLITAIPLTGGPVLIKRRNKETLRFALTSQALVLVLCSLSVLTKATLEFARMDIRFGVYVSMVGAMVSTLYAFLRLQEQRRREVEEIFMQPEIAKTIEEVIEEEPPAPVFDPPKPPVATEAETHLLHR